MCVCVCVWYMYIVVLLIVFTMLLLISVVLQASLKWIMEQILDDTTYGRLVTRKL